MLKLTVLAAALAAGLTTFAARADDTTMHGEKVAAMRAEMRAARAKAAEAATVKEGKEQKAATSKPRNKAVAKRKSGSTTVAKAGAAKAGATRKAPKVAAAKAKAGKSKVAGTAPSAAAVVTAAKKTSEALTPQQMAAAAAYGPIVSRYASTYGVPVSLANAVIHVESSYRPDARGSAGEVGLMQIKPATARMMGYSGSTAGLFNPETNIKFGMKYLAKAHELGGGTTCGTILKYNAGHAAKRMNPVSSAYCSKVKQRLGAN